MEDINVIAKRHRIMELTGAIMASLSELAVLYGEIWPTADPPQAAYVQEWNRKLEYWRRRLGEA